MSWCESLQATLVTYSGLFPATWSYAIAVLRELKGQRPDAVLCNAAPVVLFCFGVRILMFVFDV